jgi:hypothetical protein
MNIRFSHVLRRLRHSPTFTAVTLLTIGIGIGANTAMFSVVNGILLKPLPYRDPEALVGVWQTAPALNIKDLQASPSDYFTFRDENRSFEHFGVWNSGSVSVTGLGPPERVQSLSVTEGTLNALGVQPALGRWFTPKDDSPESPDTIILTDEYWHRRFGGEASAIGRGLLVDGKVREIIGVMPRDFRFLDEKPSLILPMRFNRSKTILGNFSFKPLARLKPGVPWHRRMPMCAA